VRAKQRVASIELYLMINQIIEIVSFITVLQDHYDGEHRQKETVIRNHVETVSKPLPQGRFLSVSKAVSCLFQHKRLSFLLKIFMIKITLSSWKAHFFFLY
jgi:hypothetical protein